MQPRPAPTGGSAAVGDVPATTLRQFVQALQRQTIIIAAAAARRCRGPSCVPERPPMAGLPRAAMLLLTAWLLIALSALPAMARAQSLPVSPNWSSASARRWSTSARFRRARQAGGADVDRTWRFLRRFRHPAAGAAPPAATTSRCARHRLGLHPERRRLRDDQPHVVGRRRLIVTLTDKRELKARIVGTDRRTDIALVRSKPPGCRWSESATATG